MLANKISLPIHEMDQRHHGLTKALADSYTEAARVCLDRHHESPAEFSLSSDGSIKLVAAEWETTESRTRNAWANEIDATEAGACACALAAAELSEGLVAVGRAETKTGADYYIAPAGTPLDNLEECLRFEISGVDHGPINEIERRLKAKLKQAEAGNSNLPAMAGVVGFKARLILLAPLEK